MSDNAFLDLHLKVLKDLINGVSFDAIKHRYSKEFRALNYLERATGPLLTFKEEKLVAAYPVSPHPTKYRVNIEDIGTGYAMCAIDALGIAFTFLKPTQVKTKTIDTDKFLKINIDPKEKQQPKYDFFVTYLKIDNSIENIALQQCPSINFYQFQENVPNQKNLVVIDFSTALEYAEQRFSQSAILSCLNGSLSIEFNNNTSRSSTTNSCCCDFE